MKVVLFCGGLGMRLRDYADNVPKPMVPIGSRPILWHLMKYYAHRGAKDFILCLGYRGDAIRSFFLDRTEDWSISFVDTGQRANIGERLRAVEPFLVGENLFLANYADGLTDLPLAAQMAHFESHDAVASFLSVRPHLRYHGVTTREDGLVTQLNGLSSEVRVNGGFFIFRRDIFRYLRKGEDLVEEPFQRLIAERRLIAYRYDGFWMAVDTAKDMDRVDTLYAVGHPPWMVWEGAATNRPA